MYSQEKVPQDVLKARASSYETKYDKIAKNDLEIIYKGRSFTFGDSFNSVKNKISERAKYICAFDETNPAVKYGFSSNIGDEMIICEDAKFFFENEQFAYFEIMSKSFPVKLRVHIGNNGVVNLRVGQSVNVLKKLFKKTFAEKLTEGDAYRDVFIVNVGDLYADSPIANNLLIKVEKGTDKISIIAFYGY